MWCLSAVWCAWAQEGCPAPYGEITWGCALDKLPSDNSDRAVGHEFNVNELTMYIKQCVIGQKHT